MGEITGFIKYDRQDFSKESVKSRVKHWREFIVPLSEEEIKIQGARCMECGIPFCHWGCPLGNFIPDWNDFVYKGHWQKAIERLHYSNNFPEFTGRICPALCECSCVLGINKNAVSIKNIEFLIVDKAYKMNWITPKPPKTRTDKTVAVIGSGPAGLTCADELNKKGHKVTVFEKNEDVGGLLRFGIPDFKLEKWIIDRRIHLMKKEGIEFQTRTNIGSDITAKYIHKQFDAMVIACGAEEQRDLNVPGRELQGVYQAIHYLSQQNRVNSGQRIESSKRIDAKNRNVIVLGGGDTGSDCVGTANRQGAKSVKQFELLPKLPEERRPDNPWPEWAFTYKKTTSHEEGVEQDYCVLTKHLSGQNGKLKKLHAVRLEYGQIDSTTGRPQIKEIADSKFDVECDLLFLAMGFLGPVQNGLISELNLELDNRGNVKTDENYMTNINGIFAAGDMRRGQSLVVWAISEGRNAAACAHNWLMRKYGKY